MRCPAGRISVIQIQTRAASAELGASALCNLSLLGYRILVGMHVPLEYAGEYCS
jgi:hypothetical protein